MRHEPVGQVGLFDTPPPSAPADPLGSFHVRSLTTLAEALEGDRKAKRQEVRVLALFQARPGQRLTPSEVHAILQDEGHRLLLTSVRRALTNLCDARRYDPPPLVHYPKDRRPGPFGSKESTWGLAG